MILLSAMVLTKNNLPAVKRCLTSLQFCDEIVVADDVSTDGTWEYLQQHGPKVRAFQRKFDTFANQRTFLHPHLRGKWTLVVDSDECVSAELATELAERLPQLKLDAYFVPLRNHLPRYWGSRPHFTVRQKRLLHTRAVSWIPTEWVHAPIRHQGPAGTLRWPLEHYSYDSFAHLAKKQVAYGLSGGRHEFNEGGHTSSLGLLAHSAATFFKYYLFKGLFRFGVGGLVGAAALSWGVFCKYAALWDLGQGTPGAERPVSL